MQAGSSTHRRLGALAGASAAALAALAIASPCLASAGASHLLLESAGSPAAVGSPAYATVRFGACGTILAGGTLSSNNEPKDTAAFTEGSSTGGGCGESGPSLEGKVLSASVTKKGVLMLLGEMVYITRLPKPCTYKVHKLEGTFAIPGSTAATVSGTGRRLGGSSIGCTMTVELEGVEGTFGSVQKGPAFEASLD